MDVVPIIEPYGEGGGLFIPDRTLDKWLCQPILQNTQGGRAKKMRNHRAVLNP